MSGDVQDMCEILERILAALLEMSETLRTLTAEVAEPKAKP